MWLSLLLGVSMAFMIPQDHLSARITSPDLYRTSITHAADSSGMDCTKENCLTSKHSGPALEDVFYVEKETNSNYEDAYFIKNEASSNANGGARLYCSTEASGSSGWVRSTKGAFEPYQLWQFQDMGDEKWQIKEYNAPHRVIAALGDEGDIACLDPTEKTNLSKLKEMAMWWTNSPVQRWFVAEKGQKVQERNHPWYEIGRFWAFNEPQPGTKAYYTSFAAGAFLRGMISTVPAKDMHNGWTDLGGFYAYPAEQPGTTPMHVYIHVPGRPCTCGSCDAWGAEAAVGSDGETRSSDATRFKFTPEIEQNGCGGWGYRFSFWVFINKPSSFELKAHKDWNFEDIYETEAMWSEIFYENNGAPFGVKPTSYKESHSWGITQSYSTSTAKKYGYSVSLTVSAGAEIKGIGLSSEMTTSAYNDFEEIVQHASTADYKVTKEIIVYIPSQTCLQMVQLKVNQNDPLSTTFMEGYFQRMYLRDCSPCQFIDGEAKGTKKEPLDNTVSVEECLIQTQSRRPQSNGLTWDKNTHECWAIQNANMIDQAGSQALTSCIFGYSGQQEGGTEEGEELHPEADPNYNCPSDFPYVFRPTRDMCCKTTKDSNGVQWSAGGNSMTCYKNEFTVCPSPMSTNCIDAQGTKSIGRRQTSYMLRKPDFKVGLVELDCEGLVRDAACPPMEGSVPAQSGGVSAQSGGITFAGKGEHTLDQEYHMKEADTDVQYTKEETWSRKEIKNKEADEEAIAFTRNEKTPFAVNILAALGFCVTMFGAFRHYTTK